MKLKLFIRSGHLQVRDLLLIPSCNLQDSSFSDISYFFRLQDISDKTNLIRLNRELRDFKEQSEVLRFESEQRKLVRFQSFLQINYSFLFHYSKRSYMYLFSEIG